MNVQNNNRPCHHQGLLPEFGGRWIWTLNWSYPSSLHPPPTPKALRLKGAKMKSIRNVWGSHGEYNSLNWEDGKYGAVRGADIDIARKAEALTLDNFSDILIVLSLFHCTDILQLITSCQVKLTGSEFIWDKLKDNNKKRKEKKKTHVLCLDVYKIQLR